MYCLAIMNSGNQAVRLAELFEKKGIRLEVVSTPCKIAIEGCSYCLQFPEEMLNEIKETAAEKDIKIQSIYLKRKEALINKYEKIF